MDAVLTTMVEEKIGPGDRNRLLISTAKEHLQYDYALALRSPAFALHFALKSLIKQGQESTQIASFKAVVISALSPRYYLQVLQDLSLTPIYCDVTYDFPCMNKDLIESVISKKNSDLEVIGIVLHHTLGFVPDALSVSELGIPIIEDISQSYGSWLKPADKDKDNKEETPNEPKAQRKTETEGRVSPLSGSTQFFVLGLEERDMLTSGGGALLF